MALEWLASLLVLPCLLLLIRLMRQIFSDWYAPAILFPLVWIVGMGVPLLFAPEYSNWPLGVWILGVMLGVFSLCCHFGYQKEIAGISPSAPSAGSQTQTPALFSESNTRILVLALALCIGMGCLALDILLKEGGKAWIDMISVETWVEIGAKFSYARYTEGYVEPPMARLGIFCYYLGSLLGGVLMAGFRKSWLRRTVGITPVLLSVVYASIMTTRAAFLYCIILWISSYFAVKAYSGQPFRKPFDFKLAVGSAALLGLLFLIFLLLGASRAGFKEMDQVIGLLDHTKVWFCGHLAGFSIWLRDHFVDGAGLSWGQKTFGGPFQILGAGVRVQGVYTDEVILTAQESTNVYTMFRGLIEDFGIAGAIAAMAVGGYVTGRVYAWVRKGKVFAIPLLAAIYATILWSPIICILTYNTVIIAYLLLGGVLYVMQYNGVRTGLPGGEV